MAFFLSVSLANLPRGKKKYGSYIDVNTTTQPYDVSLAEEGK